MYLLVVPPTPPAPPPSFLCANLNLGCPPPAPPPNPDSLAALEPYLQTEVDAPQWTGLATKPTGMTGMGDYERQRYSYLFHPRLTTNRTMGMGCSKGHCDCGGTCGGHGMGDDSTGLFSSGLDVTSWGPTEWIVAGLIGLGGLSIITNTVKGGRKVQGAVKRSRSRSKKRAAARAALKSAGGWGF